MRVTRSSTSTLTSASICEACVPECPVEAIFHEDNVPEEWAGFTELNAEMAPQCEVITEKKEPLVDE